MTSHPKFDDAIAVIAVADNIDDEGGGLIVFFFEIPEISHTWPLQSGRDIFLEPYFSDCDNDYDVFPGAHNQNTFLIQEDGFASCFHPPKLWRRSHAEY